MHCKVRRVELIITMVIEIISLSLSGCKFLCFPGTFNIATGPAHWELLIRSRQASILLQATIFRATAEDVVSDVTMLFFN